MSDMYFLNINCIDLDKTMLCNLKIELIDDSLNQKYLNHLRTCLRHKEKPYYTYFYDLFHSFVLNISQTALQKANAQIFKMLKYYKKDTTGLYYILGEFNNFGITNVQQVNNHLILQLQFDFYYQLQDFTNASAMLTNSGHSIYARYLTDQQHSFNTFHMEE